MKGATLGTGHGEIYTFPEPRYSSSTIAAVGIVIHALRDPNLAG